MMRDHKGGIGADPGLRPGMLADLLVLSRELSAVRDRARLRRVLDEQLAKLLCCCHHWMLLTDAGKGSYTRLILETDAGCSCDANDIGLSIGEYPLDDRVLSMAAGSPAPVVMNLDRLIEELGAPGWFRGIDADGMREMMLTRLITDDGVVGVFVLFSRQKGQIGGREERVVQGISCQLGHTVANILANEKIEWQEQEIGRYKQLLEGEYTYPQEEMKDAGRFGGMIGASTGMRKVFGLVSQVAGADSSVMVTGETGTGKELIARAIHDHSRRKDRPMIKVNCAALPATLIESELFGHERGSFTGATDRRIGKFEMADKGTLFLDEVGELPLELQAKLLRALQEKEIERIGGRGVIGTDVRIIAATNRDLGQEVQLGRFRSDLYYRLNVFPIVLPPLRERREDIPCLAAHFLARHDKKGQKGAMKFSQRVVKELVSYSWPGNVRELEHVIERSVLMTVGATVTRLHLSLPAGEENVLQPGARVKTIDEVEREHIVSVLRICNGKVSGIGGAAELLRLPATTLASKIKRLKICKGCHGE